LISVSVDHGYALNISVNDANDFDLV
jgi:hypothetical protein